MTYYSCECSAKNFHRKTLSLIAVASSAGYFVALGQTARAADASSSETSSGSLAEVIVTAQKKGEEKVQDVPIPMSVIDATALTDTGQVLLKDYATSVPGLTVTPQTAGNQLLTIRGITTDAGAATVGVLVDDVAFAGAGSGASGYTEVPDIDPGDLARIEVLRGPQGTLYGDNSMGGLLRFVTVDPSSSMGFGGRVEAGASGVYNGAEPGYSVRASANVPVTETLALRVSGFTRTDAGYIDNPVLDRNGTNESRAYGGRLSALWQPSELISLKVNVLFQHDKQDGTSDVYLPTSGYPQTAGLGDLQNTSIPGGGEVDRTLSAYSATLKAKLGDIDLTSITGYSIHRFSDLFDYTYYLSPASYFGVSGGFSGADDKFSNFSQEIRLSGPTGGPVEWLLGGFYTHQDTPDHEFVQAAVPTTGQIVGLIYNYVAPFTFDEDAAFADITWHITKSFNIQIGGRETHIKEDEKGSTTTGLFSFLGVATPIVAPGWVASSNTFTYLLTPQFQISEDFMAYARLSSGFRPGGSNGAATLTAGAPAEFSPDRTNDYEVGTKADFLDHRLSIDASVYYIAWQKIQLGLISNGFAYTANGGRAKSDGVELSIETKPISGQTVSAWIAYDHAVLTQGFPPTTTAAGGLYGVPGDRLPFSSRYSGNVSIEQDFPISASVTGSLGGAVSYVSDREADLTTSPVRQDLPAYAKTDLRAGIKYTSWTASFYANNVTDRRGQLNGGVAYFPPFAFSYIQPRTIGVNIVKTF